MNVIYQYSEPFVQQSLQARAAKKNYPNDEFVRGDSSTRWAPTIYKWSYKGITPLSRVK